MLTQYKLALSPNRSCHPRPEWGYRLYASLLEEVPASFASGVHQDTVTPVSQFLTVRDGSLLWTVSLLGGDSESTLRPVLERAERFHLQKDGVTLSIQNRRVQEVPDVDELLVRGAAHSGIHHLCFCTATAFKSKGQYLNLPTSRLIVQSLMKKWNGCFPDCPIEDNDGEGMEALAAGLRCKQFRLRDRMYYLKGNSIPGFVGELTLENRLGGFHRQLASALLLFSAYAGIGIKTTLGMGGIQTK